MTLDLTTELLGWRLRHPVIAAAGFWSAGVENAEALARGGAAAVTAKTCTLAARAGHPPPNYLVWSGGALNALGLPGPGAAAVAPELAEAKRRLASLGTPLLASVYAETPAEFAEIARIVARAEPDAIELNASCPNLGYDPAAKAGGQAEGIAAATAAVKAAVGCPITVKLSPHIPDIGRVARAAEEAGADAITAVNTMPAMAIDADTGRPVLSNQTGGMSGAALKPIALRCVWEIAKAVRIPVIGTGGVMNGRDAAEMLIAGATAVGVGTAVAVGGAEALGRIARELGEMGRVMREA